MLLYIVAGSSFTFTVVSVATSVLAINSYTAVYDCQITSWLNTHWLLEEQLNKKKTLIIENLA